MNKSYFVVCIICLVCASPSICATLNVPADYQTIQAAIDAAINGDNVLVADGTYTGEGNKNLDFNGKLITLKSENGADSCIIDCENSGRGLYFHTGETQDAIVEGLTIRKGRMFYGGGIYCENSSGPTIEKCTLENNFGYHAGGGITCRDNSCPVVKSCTIVNNSTDNAGGGILCFSGANAMILNCIIRSNIALGISSSVADGGGIFSGDANPTIEGCLISDNLGRFGAGIYCGYKESSPTIRNCTIVDNRADQRGGGIFCVDTIPTITNCLISNNTANTSEYFVGGGGICLMRAWAVITNSTISGNWTRQYGGGICSYVSRPRLYNTIVWGNSAAVYGNELVATLQGRISLYYCDFRNRTGDVAGTIIEENCLRKDPLFADTDLRLSVCSPCVDAGDNSAVPPGVVTDLDGNPRIFNGIVDMGAYESQVPCNRPPVADAGPDQTVEQDSHAGASVTLNGSGSYDPDDDPLTYSWTWDVGSTTGVGPTVVLPLGTTTITLVVNDGKIDSDTDAVDITVVDTTPPTINSISASPDVLWPPNHKMVEVTVTVDCEDICDPAPLCYILGVTSNEPINGPGDGNTEPDWEFTDDPLVVLLRAERAGVGTGRIYTIHVECTDASGNIASGIVEVTVPHDQGKGKGKK